MKCARSHTFIQPKHTYLTPVAYSVPCLVLCRITIVLQPCTCHGQPVPSFDRQTLKAPGRPPGPQQRQSFVDFNRSRPLNWQISGSFRNLVT